MKGGKVKRIEQGEGRERDMFAGMYGLSCFALSLCLLVCLVWYCRAVLSICCSVYTLFARLPTWLSTWGESGLSREPVSKLNTLVASTTSRLPATIRDHRVW